MSCTGLTKCMKKMKKAVWTDGLIDDEATGKELVAFFYRSVTLIPV